MKKNLTKAKVMAIACSALMLVSCKDIVIKVQKKPKNVDLSAVQNFDSLNLTDSQDFLKHLDQLKVIAVDLLIKQLASRDYRGIVRKAVRDYIEFIAARAKGPVKIDDSFYYSKDECRSAGLDFNMHEANGFLGIILKTAALSKLSEVSAGKLNPGMSKEMAAIGQIVLMELGLKVEGDVTVDDSGELTKTMGAVTITLNPIAGEEIDDATKASDAARKLSISFERALGQNYVGTFAATIDVTTGKDDKSLETMSGKLSVERKAVEDKFVHTLAFALGLKDQAPNYERAMSFTQLEEKTKLQVIDTIYPNSEKQETFTTIIDVKAGKQCKATIGGDEGAQTDLGEEPLPDGKGDDGKDEGGTTGGTTDGGTGTTGGGTTGGTTDGGKTDGGDEGKGGDEGGKDDGGTTDGGKGGKTDGDDDPKGGSSDGGGTGPGQNPGQNPGQSPVQKK